MSHEDSRTYWIIPVAAFVLAAVIVIPSLSEYYFVAMPDAKNDLKLMNSMSCDGIKLLASENYVSVPENRKLLRDKIENCAEIDLAYKSKLTKIYELGTREDKINAGFTFDLYNGWQHPAKRFQLDEELLEKERSKLIKPVIVDIPKNLREDDSVNMPYLTLVKHVNNTVIFKNNDSVQHWFDEDDGYWHVGIMEPGESFTITLDVGNYTYSNHPNHQGFFLVLPSPYD